MGYASLWKKCSECSRLPHPFDSNKYSVAPAFVTASSNVAKIGISSSSDPR